MPRQTLRDFRGDRSLLTVAQDLKISRQMLGLIESGERTPSLPLAKKIADYYKAPIETLFFNTTGNEMKQTGTE